MAYVKKITRKTEQEQYADVPLPVNDGYAEHLVDKVRSVIGMHLAGVTDAEILQAADLAMYEVTVMQPFPVAAHQENPYTMGTLLHMAGDSFTKLTAVYLYEGRMLRMGPSADTSAWRDWLRYYRGSSVEMLKLFKMHLHS